MTAESKKRIEAANAALRGTSPNNKKDAKPCREYLKSGYCPKGKDCSYWHPPPCPHFESGSCILGNRCNLRHVAKPARPSAAARKAAAAEKEKPAGKTPKGKADAKTKAKAKAKGKSKRKGANGLAAVQGDEDEGTYDADEE